MIVDDLFAELDRTAAEYGWAGLGQPERLTRRYGKRIDGHEVTVRVYANRSGTAIVGAKRMRMTWQGIRLAPEELGAGDAGKRDAVIDWLREG